MYNVTPILNIFLFSFHLGQCKLGSSLGVSEKYFDKGNGFFNTNSKQFEFMQAMHTFSKMDAPAVCKAFDLSSFKTMCDLGGT